MPSKKNMYEDKGKPLNANYHLFSTWMNIPVIILLKSKRLLCLCCCMYSFDPKLKFTLRIDLSGNVACWNGWWLGKGICIYEYIYSVTVEFSYLNFMVWFVTFNGWCGKASFLVLEIRFHILILYVTYSIL